MINGVNQSDLAAFFANQYMISGFKRQANLAIAGDLGLRRIGRMQQYFNFAIRAHYDGPMG